MLEGGRIPADRYSSRAFFDLEWTRMWTRVWLLACHESMVAAPGDFCTVDIGPESLLVARGDDGRVRAFYNVCQHRGNLLCPEALGSARILRCRYHHWQWRLDGSLAHAPGSERFPDGRPEDRLRLADVACETRCGFVWVSMHADPEPLDRFLAPIEPLIAPYGPEEFTLEQDTTIPVPCNWKTSVDVNNEGYHLRTLHPELMKVIDDRSIAIELCGVHSRITIPLGRPAKGTPWEGQLTDALREMMRAAGVDSAALEGKIADVRPAMQRAIRARSVADGVDLSSLDDDQIVDKAQFHVFPNVQLNFTARGLELYRHRPHPTDPGAAFFDEQRYARALPGAPTARPARRVLEPSALPRGSVLGQDLDLLPGLQRGMSSRGFGGLTLAPEEACIANMHHALERYIYGSEEDGALG